MAQKKIHFKFIKSILMGEYVVCNCRVKEKKFPKQIFMHDGKDVIWFFNDIFYNLHPLLKGKQIFVGHGLGFKKYFHEERVNIINRYIDLIFQTGVTEDRECFKNGVLLDKIRKIGYTLLFRIPELPIRPNSVLFSATAWNPWPYLIALISILKKLDRKIDAYLTIHPQTNKKIKKLFIEACKQKRNIRIIRTQEELMKSYSYCQCYAGGLSSVAAPFWYQKKPTIFITDYKKIELNKNMLANYTNYPTLFLNVFNESSIFFPGMKFDIQFLNRAKISHSSIKIFYRSNFDSGLTISLIKKAIEEIKTNRN